MLLWKTARLSKYGLKSVTVYRGTHQLSAGVSGASVVELKAELYRAQQDAKLAQEGLHDEERRDRKKAGIDVSDILERRNAGVEARNAKDNLSYKVCYRGLKDKERCSYAFDVLAGLLQCSQV